MRDLLAGVARFQQTVFPHLQSRFETLADGQHPDALFITCSDSRVNPELLTDCQPGELFVIRNAGNIVGRKDQADLGVAATIQYAVTALHVPRIIICGHAKCGAMQGLLNPDAVTTMPEVGKWITLAQEALQDSSNEPQVDRLTQLIQANIRLQLRNLLTFDEVAEAVNDGNLQLQGWLYDFASGHVSVHDPTTNHFVDSKNHNA